MNYKVERIDLSSINRRSRGSRCWRYPFDLLAVGESFFVPGVELTVRNNLSGAASAFAKRHGVRLTIILDRDRGGYHCLRVE